MTSMTPDGPRSREDRALGGEGGGVGLRTLQMKQMGK